MSSTQTPAQQASQVPTPPVQMTPEQMAAATQGAAQIQAAIQAVNPNASPAAIQAAMQQLAPIPGAVAVKEPSMWTSPTAKLIYGVGGAAALAGAAGYVGYKMGYKARDLELKAAPPEAIPENTNV